METWNLISPYLSAIVLIAAAGAAIWKWIAPAFSLKKTVDKHEERLVTIEEHEKKDLAALSDMEQSLKLQNRAMLSIVNHMIDGNGIEKLKASRDELQDMLMK